MKCGKKIYGLLRLMRVKQWYKNVVIFLPLIFTFHLFNFDMFLATCAGFLSLCLASSANYIINDIKDRHKDRLHPEKRTRPIAAGIISIGAGYFWAFILALAAGLIAYELSLLFILFVAGLIVLTQVYTFWLKKEAFADIITIASLFVIRAVSGIAVINVPVGPWIIITMFFLAFFLASGKRYSDLKLMKEKAGATRKTLDVYSEGILNSMLTLSATSIIITYALFVSLSKYTGLFITMPVMAYAVLYYYGKVRANAKMARHPELFIKDKRMIAAMAVYAVMVVVVLYF